MQLDADITKFRLISMRGQLQPQDGRHGTGADGDGSVQHIVREDVKSGFFPIHYLVVPKKRAASSPIRWTRYITCVSRKDDDELSADAGEQDRTKSRIIVDSFETIPAEIYAGQRLSCACG